MLAATVPWSALAQTLAITNAKIYTSTEKGVLANASIVMEAGKIIAVNPESVEADTIIDANGGVLTPGFIGVMNSLGLVEIELEAITQDSQDKKADMTFDPSLGFNPKSTAIPFARKGGITRNVVAASAEEDSIFAGQTIAVELTGEWDSIIATEQALFLKLGAVKEGSRVVGMQTLKNKLEERQQAAKQVIPKTQDDPLMADSVRENAVIDAVLAGKKTLIVSVDRGSDIVQLIKLKQRFGLNLVLLGAADAISVAPLLAKEKIPVVINAMRNLPESFDSLNNASNNAAKLTQAGVKVILTTGGDAHGIYALRYSAGHAVANGMEYSAAMKAVTANAADVFQLDAGRIAVGQSADVVLWNDDPFEYSSHVQQMWIAGEEQTVESRQDLLRDRYMTKSSMPAAYSQ